MKSFKQHIKETNVTIETQRDIEKFGSSFKKIMKRSRNGTMSAPIPKNNPTR